MRTILAVFAVLVSLCAVSASRAQTSRPYDVRQGPPFPRIANCYSAKLGPFTSTEHLDMLARYDLLIGGTHGGWDHPEQVKLFAEKLSYLRKKNPHIIVLEFSSSAPYLARWEKCADFPRGGWLLTPGGEQINGWPGSKMINLLEPEVVAWQADRSRESIVDRGHHGTFIDCMGPHFDWWACEIATGKKVEIDADTDGKADERQWLERNWREAKARLARQVRERIGPGAIFMGNQAGRETFEVINGILLEDYLDYVLDKDRDWRWVLDEYLYWTGTPRRPNLTTIVSSSGVEPPFDAWLSATGPEQEALLEKGRGLVQRMRFGLATALMGDGYFAYDLHTRWRGQHWWYPEYDAPLGYPKGPAAEQPDGTWRRDYDGGTVVVNPTKKDVAVRTAGAARDVSTGKVAAEFVIPAQDGRILIREKATGEAARAQDDGGRGEPASVQKE